MGAGQSLPLTNSRVANLQNAAALTCINGRNRALGELPEGCPPSTSVYYSARVFSNLQRYSYKTTARCTWFHNRSSPRSSLSPLRALLWSSNRFSLFPFVHHDELLANAIKIIVSPVQASLSGWTFLPFSNNRPGALAQAVPDKRDETRPHGIQASIRGGLVRIAAMRCAFAKL